MAPNQHEPPPAENAQLRAALQRNADILDAAPAEHRLWLDRVIGLTCLSPQNSESYQIWLADNFLGQVRTHGLARGVIGFLAESGSLTRAGRWGYRLRRHVPEFDKPAVFALVRQVLADPDPDWRTQAVSLVADETPTQEEAAALLTACLRDEAARVRWWAALSLSKLAPWTPGVAEELAHVVRLEPPDNPDIRAWAPIGMVRTGVNALGTMGEAARPALPALRAFLAVSPIPDEEVLGVWRAVREAMERITGCDDEGKAALLGCIPGVVAGNIPAGVGRRLLWDLARLGPAAAQSVPLLATALDNPDLASVVAEGLRCLGETARPALPALRQRLARGPGQSMGELEAWRSASRALGVISGSTAEGTAALLGFVRRALAGDFPAEVGRELLLDAGKLSPPDVRVVPLFTDALRNPDLAPAATEALSGAGSAGQPVLALALAHELPNIRRTAAGVLGKLGAKAGAAVPALVGALNDPDKQVRQAVRDALASIHTYLLVTRHLGRSEEEAFLESILESLGDEAACLIYADWLEEYGNEAGRLCAGIARERLLRSDKPQA